MLTESGQILASLKAFPAQIAPCFHANAEALARSYAPGKWTGRQMLAHIVDTEAVINERLRRFAAEAQPLVLPFDPDRWTATFRADRRDLALLERRFRAAREDSLEFLDHLSEEDWARVGVHAVRGQLTITQVAAHADWHARHHLPQVQAAIDGRTWTP